MANFINSKKYPGVQSYIKANGEKSYYIRFKDETNKLRRIKIGSEADGTTEIYCNNKRIEILNAINKGEQPPKIARLKKEKNIILDDVAELYFKSKEQTKSTKDRQSKYNKHLAPYIGQKSIIDIRKADLESIKTLIIEKKLLSKKTCNMTIELFSTIFNYGFKNELYECINPATKVERFRINNTRDRFLTQDEINKLYKKVKKYDKKNNTGGIVELFVKLSLTTGVRMDGILNIKKYDIDLGNDLIHVKDWKKGGEVYSAYITDITKNLLLKRLKKCNKNDYIISQNNSGEYIGKRKIQSILKPILDKLFNKGFENDRKNKIVIHSFRHTFASHLALNNIPLKQIQDLLNHSDIRQTIKYAKLQNEVNKQAAQNVFSN